MSEAKKPAEQKSPIKGCLGLIIAIAGFCGLVYFIPGIYREVRTINPTDRQTIILSVVIIAATTRRKKPCQH